MSVQKLKDRIVQWNVRFPLDREYRKKHNIIFGSEQHLALNQIDLYLDYLEDIVYKEIWEEAKESVKMEEDYKKGILMKEREVSKEEEADLFDKLDVSNIESSNVQIEE